jgi:hypothetical protein
VPAGEAKLDNWPAGIEAGGKREVTMIYALKQETEGQEYGLRQYHQQQKRLDQLHR